MTAMPNDDLSMLEIHRLIEDTWKRIEAFGITEDIVVRPANYKEEVLVDVLFMNVYRILEEANSLTFSTKTMYPDIPWDQIRGMRNRLAHDYSHIDRRTVWDTVQYNLATLGEMADDYIVFKNLAPDGQSRETKDARGKDIAER